MSENTTAQAEIEQAEEQVATAIEQAMVAARKPKGKLGNCECAGWEIGTTIDDEDGQGPDVTIITTGCDRQTKRTFAQGHDAKLKSLFIRAGVEGLEVRYGRAAGVLVTTDHETAADRYGFGHQVRSAVLARLDKLARGGKKIAPAPRTVGAEVAEGSEEGDLPTIPEAPAEQDTWTEEAQAATDELLAEATDEPKVKGKVGRWDYEGTVDEQGGFHYASKSGEAKVAEAGTWVPMI